LIYDHSSSSATDGIELGILPFEILLLGIHPWEYIPQNTTPNLANKLSMINELFSLDEMDYFPFPFTRIL
jgi:hypothetical protein